MTKRMAIGDVLDEALTTCENVRTMVDCLGIPLFGVILDGQITTLRVLKEVAELTGHAEEQIDVEDGDETPLDR